MNFNTQMMALLLRRRMAGSVPEGDFLTLKPDRACTVSLNAPTAGAAKLFYRVGSAGSQWVKVPAGRSASIPVGSGGQIQFYGSSGCLSSQGALYSISTGSVPFVLSGKLASLLKPDGEVTEVPAYAFSGLFKGSAARDASGLILPSGTIGDHAYAEMFRGCKQLNGVPGIPACGPYSCESMFRESGVSSLRGLVLGSTAEGSYRHMFRSCVRLSQAPDELPAIDAAPHCYETMFRGCTNLGRAPEIAATRVGERSMYGMFWGCSSLVVAPSTLPARDVFGAPYCYAYMFRKCSSLKKGPQMTVDIVSRGCFLGMFGWTGLVEAVSTPALTLDGWCYCKMYEECLSIKDLGNLPASALKAGCYMGMFWTQSNGAGNAPVGGTLRLHGSGYYIGWQDPAIGDSVTWKDDEPADEYDRTLGEVLFGKGGSQDQPLTGIVNSVSTGTLYVPSSLDSRDRSELKSRFPDKNWSKIYNL